MKDRSTTINIAEDFSRYPAGRYRSDGEFAGQRFREGHLVPALRDYSHVVVQMDGTLGYGSSFLEEAFGGLVRDSDIDTDQLRERLEIQTTDAVLRETIWTYIRDARVTDGVGVTVA
jgi:hypothetical protein